MNACLFTSKSCQCADPESLVRGSPKCITFLFFYFFFVFVLFFVDEGIDDPNITITGQSTAANEWRFAGGPMMTYHWMLAWELCDFQVIPASFAKKPYIFVIFFVGEDV